MALIYVFACVYIIGSNFSYVDDAFVMIFPKPLVLKQAWVVFWEF